MGAALAFYTLLTLAPLVMLVIMVAGMVIGKDEAQAVLLTELSGLLGDTGAEGVRHVLEAAAGEKEGPIAAIIGMAVLLIGSTTVFAELKVDLDRIWDYKAPPTSGIWALIKARLLSFGLVVTIGFLLLVSLAVSGAISAVSDHLSGGLLSAALLRVLEFSASFVVLTIAFAAIYKLLPSIPLAWRDVWVGGAVNAVLFTLGKFLIGLYLGKTAVASSYGAAGTLVVVIVWVYWCAQIFFLGAEFTKAYAARHGSKRGEGLLQAGDGDEEDAIALAHRVVRARSPGEITGTT
jgi:membrane protein